MEIEKIERYFKEHYHSLVMLAYQYLKDSNESKDLVQDVFCEILNKDTLNINDLKSYLFTSVKNRCLNVLAKNKTFETFKHEKTLDAPRIAISEPLEVAEFETHIFNLINNLPPATQNIFKLSRFENLSNQEIADQLKLSKRTVELQISNALKYLREKLFNTNDYKSELYLFFSILFEN